MDRWMDRGMKGWIHRKMDEQLGGWTDWVPEWSDGVNKLNDECMIGWRDGQNRWRMDGWMDG